MPPWWYTKVLSLLCGETPCVTARALSSFLLLMDILVWLGGTVCSLWAMSSSMSDAVWLLLVRACDGEFRWWGGGASLMYLFSNDGMMLLFCFCFFTPPTSGVASPYLLLDSHEDGEIVSLAFDITSIFFGFVLHGHVVAGSLMI
jgi:hypothetical protein